MTQNTELNYIITAVQLGGGSVVCTSFAHVRCPPARSLSLRGCSMNTGISFGLARSCFLMHSRPGSYGHNTALFHAGYVNAKCSGGKCYFNGRTCRVDVIRWTMDRFIDGKQRGRSTACRSVFLYAYVPTNRTILYNT